ncbi:MAG: aminoacetone oxidase family FAD-binding enzyme [Crocinitomix sp.]|nr:aminoacetone oxidase family FAD-binding enzyme [Crocinitomix sp.]
MKVAVIGGGAAGFFAAIHAKENFPQAEVTIFEKSKKLLAKVKVSGGGRCNVTNGCTSITELSKAYPRGEKKMRKAFGVFNTKHTMEWFEKRGIELTIQDDNCVFPVSQNSQTIIDCFLNETRRLGVVVKTESPVIGLKPLETGEIQLDFRGDNSAVFDKVIVATGGSPKRQGLDWLADLGHEIEEPVPSLFTFNMPHENVKELMGIVVEKTITKIQGTKLKSDGPLLITHWGMSGPSILKLSAFGARILSEMDYKFKIQVNWVNIQNINLVEEELLRLVDEHGQKQIASIRPYYIPDRLWRFLIEKAKLEPTKKWNELGKKGINKIVNILTNDIYDVQGKTTFKEEFVTCGGISLNSIDFKTMESRVCKNLYFTGELMDVDGITGGYNFQAAWTTAFIAGKLQESL